MQPNNFPIGVMDSGVGGLTVVHEIQRQLPNENIVYFGDSKNMPYGNKEPKEIVTLSKKIIRFLESQRVKVILLACNTISSQLEEIIPLTEVPIFDIIYPGCLAALEGKPEKGIGLIATEATVRSNIYSHTLQSLNPDVPFVSNGSKELARLIEGNEGDTEKLEKVIRLAIDPILVRKPIQNLILGCTHYPIVSEDIQKLYPQLKLIDPAVKMVSIVKGFLEKNKLLSTNSNPSLNIYTSGQMDSFLPFLDQLDIRNYDLVKKVLD